MEFTERIWATLEGGTPDKVPYAPYDNLVPRGSFERTLRNLGMGLLARRSGVWSETPNVPSLTKFTATVIAFDATSNRQPTGRVTVPD